MKNNILLSLIFCLFLVSPTYAQSSDKIFIEINAFRYGANLGILRRRHYDSEVTLYNGINMGYQVADKMRLLLGFRRLKRRTDNYYKEENYEVIKTSGAELTVGLEYSKRKKKWLYMSYMAGMYFEDATHKGRVGRPGAFLGINHRRKVIGFAGKIQLNGS